MIPTYELDGHSEVIHGEDLVHFGSLSSFSAVYCRNIASYLFLSGS